MAADNLSLTALSVWQENWRRAGFAYADKGLITLHSCNWSLLILPCLRRGKLLCEINQAWDCSSPLHQRSPASACFAARPRPWPGDEGVAQQNPRAAKIYPCSSECQ